MHLGNVCDNIIDGLHTGVMFATIAQSVERILGKDEVTSSNLVSSSAVQVDGSVDQELNM